MPLAAASKCLPEQVNTRAGCVACTARASVPAGLTGPARIGLARLGPGRGEGEGEAEAEAGAEAEAEAGIKFGGDNAVEGAKLKLAF